jgi:hypothetical protein
MAASILRPGRSYGREQDVLNPLHYLPLLERRPGAWDHAKPIQEWRQNWPKVYDRYLIALQEHLTASQATREFVRILRLHEDYSEAIITQALEKALECHCYSMDGVKQLVMGLKESLESDTPEMGEASIAMSAVSVEPVAWPEVSQFDRLLQRNAEGSES